LDSRARDRRALDHAIDVDIETACQTQKIRQEFP
jgi:hypothetical protein